MRLTTRISRVVAVGLLAGLVGCTEQGGVGGVVGGPGPSLGPVGPGAGAGTSVPGGPTTTMPAGPTTTAPSPTAPPGTPAPPATTRPPIALTLAGADLSVTRVGAPFREAVAAVSGALGRPDGDPAPTTSCIGAEDETAWEGFRLGSTGGKVSGWLSTSRTLTTPAGVTVGTTLAALRQVYGSSLQVQLPAPDADTIFFVRGVGLGGSLTGSATTDTVTSLFHGTCEPA